MKKYSLIALIVFYLFAGLNHFIVPDFYIPLIPDYLPFPSLLNYLSGATEVILGLLLLSSKYRYIACIGIVLMLLFFIPAHIYFIQSGNCFEGYFCIPEIVSWGRLIIIHPILLLWAWSNRNNASNLLAK